MEDERFKHIATDPKFRRIPKGTQKVKIDKRFQSMFKDKKFKIKYTIDKRGRPVKHNSTEDLKRYYALSSEDESSDEESESEKQQTVSDDSESDDQSDGKDEGDSETIPKNKKESQSDKPGKYIKRKNAEEMESKLVLQSGEGNISEEARNKLKDLNVDYARGEVPLFSESSSDDEETEDELSESEQIEHKWGELDADADTTNEVSNRLAACNMDWDRIRAVDLMVLFNSFLPAGGIIKSVAIYPSEFGKQRMQEEEIKGPIELVDAKPTEDKDEDEEGSQYHMEKLRQYQLNRLKYFYAVIVFDNPESANKVYTECDGMEYESSAVKLDLRFIPDDMRFNDKPKDFCDKLPEVNKYQPRFFTTTALQQVKVNLTWDETNPDRAELTQKLSSGKIDDISEADLQNYLASSSGEDEQSDGVDVDDKSDSDTESKVDVIDKYKALLQGIEEKEKSKNEKDVELEISWGIDLKDKTDKLVKEKQGNSKNMTPFQKYIEKRKEKRKERKQKKKDNEDNHDGDSDIPSDIDMSDPYFAEEFKKEEFKKPKSKKISEEVSDSGNEEKQAELELLLMNEDDSKKHFSLKKIQKNEDTKTTSKKNKKKSEDKYEDNFEINVKDERFSALFSSHHYNIDPTDPHYKKTKNMEALITEKLKRRIEDTAESEKDIPAKIMKNGESVKNNKKTEINMLVKSVKRKTKEFKNKG